MKTAASRYEALEAYRSDFLNSAQDACALSLPYLLTNDGHAKGSKLPIPWQSLGAKGVNVMSAKMMMSFFPITSSPFKLQIDDGALSQLEEAADPKVRTEIDTSLSKMERIVNQTITGSTDRVVLAQALKHAVATGNGLLFDDRKALKFYPLNRYVCHRDGNGQAVEIITVEGIARDFLPVEAKKLLKSSTNQSVSAEDSSVPSSNLTLSGDEVAIYTWAKVIDGRWQWHQEIEGEIIPNSRGTSPLDAPAWIPIRFNYVDGEAYGRGRVEEFIGDLKSLDGLMQSLVEGSAVAAKVVYLLSPGAITKASEFARAQNGDILVGRPEDLIPVQTGKQADFATAYQMITQLVQRLSEGFLIMSVRQSERTTAEEVRAVQQEVMEQLGGIIGTLTVDLVQPFIQRRIARLRRDGKLPALPKGLVRPTVVAGIEGIGRGQDREALVRLMLTLQQALGPQVASYINMDEYLKRLLAAEGIESLGLIISEETRQQQTQQAQNREIEKTVTGQLGSLAKAPIADPNINPQIGESFGFTPQNPNSPTAPSDPGAATE